MAAAVSEELLAGIRRNVWHDTEVYEGASVPTMLSLSERKMLHWLAAKLPLAGTAIVDAGAFLGGSTAALAHGLSQNTSADQCKIHSYDMFKVPDDAYSRGIIGSRPVGVSVLDLFIGNIQPLEKLVDVHEGDFETASVPTEPISILFVDLAKSERLNYRVIRQYFPKLVPGASIVIQQDHNDHSCPWVNMSMEFFSDYFEVLTDDSASRVYLYKTAIPEALLNTSFEALPIMDRMALMFTAARRSKHPASQFLCACSAAWVIYDDLGLEAATRYLDRMTPEQPWPSPTPYAQMVKLAVEQIHERGGHARYIDSYFKPKSALQRAFKRLRTFTRQKLRRSPASS